MPAAEMCYIHFACLQIPRALQSNTICKSLGPLLGETLNENMQGSCLPNSSDLCAKEQSSSPLAHPFPKVRDAPSKTGKAEPFLTTSIGYQPSESKTKPCPGATAHHQALVSNHNVSKMLNRKKVWRGADSKSSIQATVEQIC